MVQRPYGAYALITAAYWATLGGVVALAGMLQRRLPDRFSVGNLFALGLATYRLSRLVTHDKVTSTFRLPFVRPGRGPAQPEGTREVPRGTGLRRALGELFT